MTIYAQLDFDTMTVNVAPVLPAGWSSNGATSLVSTAAAKHGANGIQYSTGTSGRIQYDFGSNQTGPINNSFYFKDEVFSTANQYVAGFYSLTSGGTNQGDWRINTNRTVTIRNAALTAVNTSTATLSTGVWYHAEWLVNATTASQELKIFTNESNTPIIDLTGAWTSTATRVAALGPIAAAAGGTIDYDTVRIADGYLGPAVSVPVGTSSISDVAHVVVTTTGGTAPYTYAISQVSGTATTPQSIGAGEWLITRSLTQTLQYQVIVTDNTSLASDPVQITVDPVATNSASTWPKHPTGTLPATTWV